VTKTLIPSIWETKRLTIEDLLEEDIQTVQALYIQGSYIHQWDGGSLDEQYVSRCFTEGDLPPNGTKEQFRIQVIRIKETGVIAGILTTYHGYPEPGTFYINYLYIDKAFHKQGLGQEVVTELLSVVEQEGYHEVRANVAMKNWAALRFWTKVGLNSISGIYGDREHGSDSFADMELVKYFLIGVIKGG
jgi:ribosomal protein S18 acetylase RimI-like enzyme